MIRSRLAAPLVAALGRFTSAPRITRAPFGLLPLVVLASAGAMATFANEGVASADDETGVLSARHKVYESPQNFALELRLGPYHPRVDTASDVGSKGPYETEFGNSLRWEVAVEFDYQALRIPHFGTLGPGFSAGYTTSTANAPLVTKVMGSFTSGETTSLTIFPFYAVAVLRIDVLSRELHVPFVPYLKGGFAMALWRASNTAGTSVYVPKDASGKPTGAPSVVGEGHTVGTDLAVGLAIDLNFLDRRTSQGFDNATGVNHTFIFGELQDLNLDGLFGIQKNPLYVGNHNWVLGLGFEF
jgi:hypothetical protein